MTTAPLDAAEICAGFGAPDDVVNFAHTPGTRIVFGDGSIGRLGELAGGLSEKRRALIVTDVGLLKTGHCERAIASLADAGIEATVFAEVHENPTTDDVGRCVAAAKAGGVDLLIGLGGGSSMDTAKGCNFILTNGGQMRDYWGVGKAHADMLPLIAIPTTAGTGSECQSFALIADPVTHQKMSAAATRRAAARFAILDPSLTLTQPRLVTAHTGIDAISHAVEAAVTKKRTPASIAYAKLAFRLLDSAFEIVLDEPSNLEARARMQLGAAYAGTAIENSMLGAAHSCANPLTAHFDVVHGEAVGVMLPHVVRQNAADPEAAATYADLYDGDLAARLIELLNAARMPTHLRAYGIGTGDIPMLAKEAKAQWTAQFNPVALDDAGFAALFAAAL